MTDFYCDHGAYGLTSNRIGLDAPVWGTPQEGDGSTKDAATASSAASIAFASVPTSGALSICGITISTTGVIGAASVDAAANTLATNINATTTAVGATVAVGLPQLRNLVFARGPSSGAPAGTCQVMMRVGSATLNHVSNSNVAIATTFSAVLTLIQFTGGAGGCWGWFTQPVAFGVAGSIALTSYGCFIGTTYTTLMPTKTDTVWVRTGGGASKEIEVTYNGSSGGGSIGTRSWNIVFDTNTQWTSDVPNGRLLLKFKQQSWNNSATICLVTSNNCNSFAALRRGGFEIETVSIEVAGSFALRLDNNGGRTSTHFRNVVFRDSSAHPGGQFYPFTVSSGSETCSTYYEDCDFVHTLPQTSITQTIPLGTANNSCFKFRGCTFNHNISGVANPGPLLTVTSSARATEVVFESCGFLGYPSGYTLTTNGASWGSSDSSFNFVVSNCTGLQMPASYMGLPSGTLLNSQGLHQFIYSNVDNVDAPGFRAEDCRGVTEWVPGDLTPFPTAGAIQPVSGREWALRVLWIQAVNTSPGRQYSSIPIRMYTQLADGVRQITLKLFLPAVVTKDVSVKFNYRDASGVARADYVDVLLPDTTLWTNSASYPGFVARKMTIQSSYSIKGGSEICAVLSLVGPSPINPYASIYMHPELLVE